MTLDMKDVVAKGPANMARICLIALCMSCVTFTSHAQQALVDAVLEAEKAYPELAVEGSPFHKAFVAEVAAARASDDPMLRSSKWPLEIANRVAASKPPSLAVSQAAQ